MIGGGMAYTFFKAQGYEIGKSIARSSGIELAKSALQKAKELGVSLLLPVDASSRAWQGVRHPTDTAGRKV